MQGRVSRFPRAGTSLVRLLVTEEPGEQVVAWTPWISSCGNARSTGSSTSGPTTGAPNPREQRRRTSRYVQDRGTKT